MKTATAIIDEINLTVAALDDVVDLMLSSADKPMGGQCLQILQRKLSEDMDELWEAVQKIIKR